MTSSDSVPPMFALRSLAEARHGIASHNQFVRKGKIPKEVLNKLHEGSLVKVLAEAVNHVQHPLEFIWLQIKHVDKATKRYVGLVCPPDNDVRQYRRSQYHGLIPGMLIRFEDKHIFDIGGHLQKAS